MRVGSLIAASAGVVTGGFALRYTLWHRRIDAAFERVAFGRGRSAYVLRHGVALGSRPD